jgi:hypothetical protein
MGERPGDFRLQDRGGRGGGGGGSSADNQ